MQKQRSVLVGGLSIDVMTRKEWAARVDRICKEPRDANSVPKLIFAANGQVMTYCSIDPSFRAVFSQADAICADGSPLVWASRMTSTPLPERAATTDLFHDVATQANRSGQSFYFLGSNATSNAAIRNAVTALYPRIRIVGFADGYFETTDEKRIVAEIDRARPDILWIGLGIDKQARFAVENRRALSSVACIITCGGLFDYFDAKVARAPLWMQRFALEWLFRTYQNPRKYFWRYALTNPVAIWLLLTRTRSLADPAVIER